MDPVKMGRQIAQLRKERNMTQRQLAEQLHVTDKAISKWERGMGCPELSLLTDLARILGASMEHLLEGELEENQPFGGNMKRLRFYFCPVCGNLITAAAPAAISCCGKRLEPLEVQSTLEHEKLTVEQSDGRCML